MNWIFPGEQFALVFTDTGAEGDGLYENLGRLEAYLGRPIRWLVPKRNLFELIADFNGFLPGVNSRYCTKLLKLQPFEAAMEGLRQNGENVYSYVGVRADENTRVGLLSHMDWLITEFPFRELGIGREEVFQILAHTIGVPATYKIRSRSGCYCCPFVRRSELAALLAVSPAEFASGQKYEKLSAADIDRFPENADEIWRESGLAPNHLTLPVPKRIDCRTRTHASPVKWGTADGRRQTGGRDLFDAEPMAGLWVGAEFFVDENVGDHGIWWQGLVTYSSTRAGLQMQLQKHWELRVQTPEAHGMTVEEMKADLKLAMYFIEVPASLLDMGKLGKGSYTWRSGESYGQLKHRLMWAARSLHAEGLRQMVAEYAGAPEPSWRWEQWSACVTALGRIKNETGRVLASDLFEPVDEIQEEDDERVIACFHCSI